MPFCRIDRDESASDFQILALEPGWPAIDPHQTTTPAIRRILGRFWPEIKFTEDRLELSVLSDARRPVETADIRPCSPKTIAKHSEELEELEKRLKKAKCETSTEESILRVIRATLKEQTHDLLAPEIGVMFFEYREKKGPWRLLWLFGVRRTENTPAEAMVCKRPECRLLYTKPAEMKKLPCPACYPKEEAAPPARPFPWKRYAALLLLLLLLAGGAWLAYWLQLPRSVLEGKVIAADTGRPIANAEVTLAGKLEAISTNEEGIFSVDQLPPGNIEVKVRAAGYAPAKKSPYLPWRDTATERFELAGDAAIAGRVIDFISQVGVAGVRVKLQDADAIAVTDAEGKFRLEGLHSGPAALEIEADGYKPHVEELRLQSMADTPVTLSVAGAASLVAEVVSEKDGVPLPRATVVFGLHEAAMQEGNKFQIDNLRSGKAKATFTAPGYLPVEKELTLVPGANPIRVSLRGNSVVTGRVYDPLNELAIENAVIQLGDKLSTRTNEEGIFRLLGVPGGQTELAVSANGYEGVSLPLNTDTAATDGTDGDMKVVSAGTIELKSNLAVTGSVINAINNKPIPNVRISFNGNRPRLSDSEGKFRLSGLPARLLKLNIEADGFHGKEMEIDPRGGETDYRIVLSPVLKEGEVRIVLTWDRLPPDLDAHLFWQFPNEPQLHVFHAHKAEPNVLLDVDDTDSYGPETITLKNPRAGVYALYIHMYKADPSQDASKALATSQAKVAIYHHGRSEPQEFSVDPAATKKVWRVAVIKVGEQKEVQVVPFSAPLYVDNVNAPLENLP